MICTNFEIDIYFIYEKAFIESGSPCPQSLAYANRILCNTTKMTVFGKSLYTSDNEARNLEFW